jgi:hypothetical protein
MRVFSTLLELIQIGRLSNSEKDLEILVLRKQLAIVEHQLNKPVHLSRVERLTLAVICVKLKAATGRSVQQLRDVIRLVQPEIMLRWHHELVRRKWTYQRKNTGGRPDTPQALERLIVQFAQEDTHWEYGKIQGELLKADYNISEETIANLLERYGIPSVPTRGRSPSWRHSHDALQRPMPRL